MWFTNPTLSYLIVATGLSGSEHLGEKLTGMRQKHRGRQFQLPLLMGDNRQGIVLELFIGQWDELQVRIVEIVFEADPGLETYA